MSIFGAVYELVFHCILAGNGGRPAAEKGKEKEGDSKGKPVPSATPLIKRIVVDGCDLLIPGLFLGWTPIGDFGVGLAMLLSTVVTARDIWINVNG